MLQMVDSDRVVLDRQGNRAGRVALFGMNLARQAQLPRHLQVLDEERLPGRIAVPSQVREMRETAAVDLREEFGENPVHVGPDAEISHRAGSGQTKEEGG